MSLYCYRLFTLLLVLAVCVSELDAFAIDRQYDIDTTKRDGFISTESYLQVKHDFNYTDFVTSTNATGNNTNGTTFALEVINRNDSLSNATTPSLTDVKNGTDTLEIIANPASTTSLNMTVVTSDFTSATNINQNMYTTSDLNITTPATTNTVEVMETTTVYNTTVTVPSDVMTIAPLNVSRNEITVTDSGSIAYTSEKTVRVWGTEVNNVSSYSTMPVGTGQTQTADNLSIVNIDDRSHNETSTTYLMLIGLNNTNENELTRKHEPTERMTGEQSAFTAVPYRKMYVEIDRKRSTVTEIEESSESTTTSNTEKLDLLRSETAQSISLERAFNITPDLLATTRSLTTESPVNLHEMNLYETTNNATLGLETSTFMTDGSDTTSLEMINKTEGLTSKRAGFLDNSLRTTTVPNVKASKVVISSAINQNTTTTILLTTTAKTTTVNNMKSTSLWTSQSKLSEDEINEEFMKEYMLNNGLSSHVREDVGNITVDVNSEMPELGTSTPKFTDPYEEEKLSVKPIAFERARNNGLYTVSPNYKPLKKIEVQPPKPFVRDPDDNSWRNESLSSLGIVFKANNSTKPFTQVLKNKSETELSLTEKSNKSGEQGLRERLEKIAEMRKSKKNRYQVGESLYTDYEESGEYVKSPKTVVTENVYMHSTTPEPELTSEVSVYVNPTTDPDTTVVTENVFMNLNITDPDIKFNEFEKVTPKKGGDEYESDDDDSDYKLANVDLKKNTLPPLTTPKQKQSPLRKLLQKPILNIGAQAAPPSMRTYLPDRKPTIQYFPPREQQKKILSRDYDDHFRNKINTYTSSAVEVDPLDTYTYKNVPPKIQIISTEPTYRFPKNKYDQTRRTNDVYRNAPNMDKNIYLTNIGPANRDGYGVEDEGNGNSASFVIKHLDELIDGSLRDASARLVTEPAVRLMTTHGVSKESKGKASGDYYDYEAQFKKDVLDRFVENFNQNSEKFRVDFPIVYNSSVVHSSLQDAGGAGGAGGREASSSAFMKRLYEDAAAFGRGLPRRGDCERTVELAPAYELHYYVPEEEEKEEVDGRDFSAQMPYKYRT